VVSLAEDLKLALDRVAFARSLGTVPDPWQLDLLRSGSQRVLLNITRQGGKSSMAAIIALHRALYHPQSLILCLARPYARAKSYSQRSPPFIGSWTSPSHLLQGRG
jgi:hypothetical protein